MGWQDDPVVDAPAAGQPRWASDPVVGAAKPQAYSPSTAPPSFAEASKHLYDAEMEGRRLARQGVSPNVFSQYAPAKPQKLGELEEFEWGQGYRGVNPQTGQREELRINPQTDFVGADPETGKPAVFARHTAAAGGEAHTLTNEGALTRIAREVVPGLAVGPATGLQKTAQGVRAIDTVGTQSGAALATQRAAEGVRDAQAFENLDVRKFGPAFNQGPTASVAKQLAETYLVGAPIRNALEETVRDTANAGRRIADAMAPSASVEQTGAALQRGLDRYRTAGIRSLEPGVLENLGVEAVAPVQPRAVMSAEAARRAEQAGQIRAATGETATATTSRGTEVPAARPLEQTVLARRSAEDMSPQELSAIIRAPGAETSFAARQEALFEHAWQQIPAKFKINDARNPDLLRAVNTDQAFRQIAGTEQRAGISGGVVGGRFADMAQRVRTNVTLPTLKAMRTEIGRALSNFGIYDARLDRTQMKQLYAAISRDIEVGVMDMANRARIQSQLGNNRADAVGIEAARRAEGALYALRRADRYTRMGVERMDRFSKVVGTENPQAAAGMLIRSALDGTKGNMGMLRTAMSVLRPEERNEVSALVLRELGKPRPSAGGIVQEVGFSPETALTNWQAMNPAARKLLFGGEHAAAIDDFVRVVSRLANVEKMANRSRSGTNVMNLSGLAAAVVSAVQGNILVPLGLGGLGLGMSVLMSRPAYVRWATAYAQLRAAALRAPLNTSGGRLTAHVQRLGLLAQKDPALLPVYRAIAQENGVKQAPDNQKPEEQQPRLH